ncbi:hypothetical protein V496_01109 [Pseudogymnoascus sp. VKM F-4515 (FW-2607)]|nr:hypothetical protein V496_01109 [Pseudogymnoascus sp. VKM F-4515 (FW-2607)]KFY92242.1 hypothetical protein V498_05098 [Pseudogymnoascus sp. VKM F-4517 (FW-2822)]
MQPQRVRAKKSTDDNPVFFYRPHERHGLFSQWYPSCFTVLNSSVTALVGPHLFSDSPDSCTAFNCAEQFMMYCKAARFSDNPCQSQILNTDNPGDQKKLGQEVKGYDEVSWREVNSAVVEMGNYAKFGQDKRLKEYLLGTGERELVEASVTDRIWGIGFSAKTDVGERMALANRDQWGENKLGKALVAVRARLREEDKGIEVSQK